MSGYGRIDFQIACMNVNHADGVKVAILSPMQNKSSDASWQLVGETDFLITAPKWVHLKVPGDLSAPQTIPLFRYLRYRITASFAEEYALTSFAPAGCKPAAAGSA